MEAGQMQIAIIGAGNVGAALARGWTRAGHKVVFGLRDLQKHRALVEALGAEALPPDQAAARGDVVVLALPWDGIAATLAGLGDLAGKVVIDCTNPLGRGPGGFGLVVGFDTSGGEQVAALLPGARVVKTLNQVGAEVMADAGAMAHRPAMFMAGDDVAAKALVAGLLRDLGFDAMDAGGLIKARLLEPYAMVWINQALMQGKGRAWALAAVDHAGGGRHD
jgi:8-hydroxy-5-deazaflavin:NADPH oxidoreductase